LKSQNYSDRSVQAVLGRLDDATFLRQLGISNGDFTQNDQETRCYCPVCHDRSKMSFVIERDSRRAYCTNLPCQASSMNVGGGNLLELYALAKDCDLDTALEELSQTLGVSLERQDAEALAAISENFRFVEIGHSVKTDGDELNLQPALYSFEGQEGHGRGIVVSLDELPQFTA
jgi:hypothetical protein